MIVERPDYYNFEPLQFKEAAEKFNTVELKYDGWYTWLAIEGSKVEVYSRTSRLIDVIALSKPMPSSVLCAEYLFGQQWAKDRADIYGKFAVFGATETIMGQPVSGLAAKDCRALVKEAILALADEALGARLFQTTQWAAGEAEAVWSKYVVGERFEGLCYINDHKPYGSELGRMKAGATLDYVCLGFEPSDSDTYAGWGVKSVHGGLYIDGVLQTDMDGPGTCRVGGITAEQRKEFYDHPELYIGKVFEAGGKKVMKSGAMRHPYFIRWRDDKRPEDCVLPK